jgi:5-methylcytosine-specific restriction endonuclease McrA
MRDIYGKFIRGDKESCQFSSGYTPWNKGDNNWGMVIQCYQCGKDFRIKKYRLSRSKYLHCSKECATKTQDRGYSTFWERIKKSPEYRFWRKEVFERDNYTCQECGTRGIPIQAHHIKPKCLYFDLVFDVDNGETLCIPCHKKTDSYGSNFGGIKKGKNVTGLIPTR